MIPLISAYSSLTATEVTPRWQDLSGKYLHSGPPSSQVDEQAIEWFLSNCEDTELLVPSI